MMKANIKHFVITFAVLPLVATVIIPNIISAQTPNPPVKKVNAFCEKINDFAGKITGRLTGQQEKLQTKRTEREGILSQKSDDFAKKLEENRTKWDENRTENFTKLEEKAKTDSQRQAVLKFKRDIESAVLARKTAVDKAFLDFKTGIGNALMDKKTATDLTEKTFTDSVNVAVEKAKAECVSNADGKTVRATLAESLKVGKDKLKGDIKGIEKTGERVMALVEIRKQAMEKAKADFKAEVERARVEIRAVFGTTEE